MVGVGRLHLQVGVRRQVLLLQVVVVHRMVVLVVGLRKQFQDVGVDQVREVLQVVLLGVVSPPDGLRSRRSQRRSRSGANSVAKMEVQGYRIRKTDR